MLRAVLRGCALALGVVATSPLPAHADDGPAGSGPPGRPPRTVLRPASADDPVRRAEAVVLGSAECIVAVSGIGSRATDATFDRLLAPYRDDPRFEVHRFGLSDDGRSEEDRAGSLGYDTLGSISRNAERLVQKVRAIAPRCAATHIVTHSMGGAVADRAFSMGLSAADGVATYLPLAGPHNGASAARVIRFVVAIDDGFADRLGDLAHGMDLPDPRSDAARDLAEVTPPRPLRNVAALRLRMVTDPVVLRRDHLDRRWHSREYLPDDLADANGHGGILEDGRVAAILGATVAARAVPADERSALYREAARQVDLAVETEMTALFLAAGALGTAAAAANRVFASLHDLVVEILRSDAPAEDSPG